MATNFDAVLWPLAIGVLENAGRSEQNASKLMQSICHYTLDGKESFEQSLADVCSHNNFRNTKFYIYLLSAFLR